MKYFSTDPYGITIVEPSEEQRKTVLKAVLEDADQAEFPEAYLNGPDGIVIGFRSDGCLLWEESGTVKRYLPGIDLETALSAWNLLVKRDLDQLDSLEWKSIQ